MSERYPLIDPPILYLFNQILPEEQRFLNCTYIHPIKQRALAETVKKADACLSVEYLAVFGSILADRCWDGSDIDLVIWDSTHTFRPPNNDAYDLFYADELDESWAVFDDIVHKGVVVYARHNAGDFEE